VCTIGRLGIAKTKAKILPNQAEHMEMDYAGKPEENATQFTEQYSIPM
jgi:hypothetical protein